VMRSWRPTAPGASMARLTQAQRAGVPWLGRLP
jgi:hypothetical protein